MRCDECKWGQSIPEKDLPESTSTSFNVRWWWFDKKIVYVSPARTVPEYVSCHFYWPHMGVTYNGMAGYIVDPDWFCRNWEES